MSEKKEKSEVKAPAVGAPVVKSAGPTVAKGKSITTKVGVLGEGDSIAADVLAGGSESLKQLIDKGYVNA